MPIEVPNLDNRRYQDLVNEALARVPVHTPEWTNFGQSDPGVTIVELFAFLTETLLYRANQIPERNRKKFLELLGLPLSPGAAAEGIVAFRNERGPAEIAVLPSDTEVRAGEVPFRTEKGLDLLPVEGRVFYKRRLERTPDELDALRRYYEQLYAAYLLPVGSASGLELYESVAFTGESPVRFGDALDDSLWLALLARPNEDPERMRGVLAERTLSLGLVPAFDESRRELTPAGRYDAATRPLLTYEVPDVKPPPADGSTREASYKQLQAAADDDVLRLPGIVQLKLPPKAELSTWDDLDPHEAGARDFPPAVDDPKLAQRLITWIRLRSVMASDVALLWVGINAAMVSQRQSVLGEPLGAGTGMPDQVFTLANPPVIPGSVRIRAVEKVDGRIVAQTEFSEVTDLFRAGPEVRVEDPRLPPGSEPSARDANVFALDPEAGRVRFGDGQRGRRPAAGALLSADYAYGVGARGNVAAFAINKAAALPAGVAVANPVRTWGGAAPETAAEGEKQITRFLQHRDRLVSASDFVSITRRTPGVQKGRVDVLTAFNPELGSNEAGDAAGAVTLMVVPKPSNASVVAPEPDRPFLDAICRYLEPRRLLTTEIFLRGPAYKPIWVSVGIDVTAGRSIAEVEQAVRDAIGQFLSPLPSGETDWSDDEPFVTPASYDEARQGWPLKKPVLSLEIQAVASRVDGVAFVSGVLLMGEDGRTVDRIPMAGLELPKLVGLSVGSGDPAPLERLRGSPATGGDSAAKRVPVPVVPENC